jgi:hypothetical protein
MVMFFGLMNSLATFQMMMNTIFWHEVQEGWFSIFMDNSIIYTKWWPGETEEQHQQRHQELVHHIFNILEENDLYVKPEKCVFKQEEIKYLGVIMGKGKTRMDPKKLMVVANYEVPKNTTDVQAFLGFTSYYWYFMPGYSQVAQPLLDLIKKTTPWHWGPNQEKAFVTLKCLMCSVPVLTQLNFNKKFYLQMDASGYGMGAILSQEGDTETLISALAKKTKLILHPIVYYLATFTPTERNYDVYNWELLAIMKALAHWQQYLGWTKMPFMILMNHANLQHWKSLQNLVWHMAQWHIDLQEYNYKIQYISGKENGPPDVLSQQPRVDKGQEDNQGVVVILAEKFKISATSHITPDGKVCIPPLDEVKRGVMHLIHDHPTTEHPGWDKTIWKTQKQYYWPGMKEWIMEYVKGCVVCQQNKILTHQKETPTYQIPTKESTWPFQRVTMDLIMGLLPVKGKDVILTIVDQGCSCMAVFLPCSATITGPRITQLYHDHVYWWFGLPTKVISDWDLRFTSHFSKAFMKWLVVEQNISMAFHPQTDGLSEWKNQWVKQYLRLVSSTAPKDWMYWMVLALAIHNNQRNTMTGLSPNQILLGYEITLNPRDTSPTTTKSAKECHCIMMEWRAQAIMAINQAVKKMGRQEAQYTMGAQVWLEGKNLKLPYQSTKLVLRWYGPFKIIKEVSPVAWGTHCCSPLLWLD